MSEEQIEKIHGKVIRELSRYITDNAERMQYALNINIGLLDARSITPSAFVMMGGWTEETNKKIREIANKNGYKVNFGTIKRKEFLRIMRA